MTAVRQDEESAFCGPGKSDREVHEVPAASLRCVAWEKFVAAEGSALTSPVHYETPIMNIKNVSTDISTMILC